MLLHINRRENRTGTIMNGQSRDTGKIKHAIHNTKKNHTQQHEPQRKAG